MCGPVLRGSEGSNNLSVKTSTVSMHDDVDHLCVIKRELLCLFVLNESFWDTLRVTSMVRQAFKYCDISSAKISKATTSSFLKGLFSDKYSLLKVLFYVRQIVQKALYDIMRPPYSEQQNMAFYDAVLERLLTAASHETSKFLESLKVQVSAKTVKEPAFYEYAQKVIETASKERVKFSVVANRPNIREYLLDGRASMSVDQFILGHFYEECSPEKAAKYDSKSFGKKKSSSSYSATKSMKYRNGNHFVNPERAKRAYHGATKTAGSQSYGPPEPTMKEKYDQVKKMLAGTGAAYNQHWCINYLLFGHCSFAHCCQTASERIPACLTNKSISSRSALNGVRESDDFWFCSSYYL